MTRGSGTSLRSTTESDFAALRTLFDDPVFLNWGGPGRSSDERIREKYLGSRLPEVECFIVEVDHRDVGLAILHAEPGGGGIDLILLPEARGRGVGRAVVADLVHRARRERGWSHITVDPDCVNESGIRFWQAAGFVPERVIVDEPDRQPYLLMVLTT